MTVILAHAIPALENLPLWATGIDPAAHHDAFQSHHPASRV